MSTVKKEARLSGMLLARKGAAAPAHTDHKLTVQAMDEFSSKKHKSDLVDETSTEQVINGEWVAAVSKIAELTQKQNNAVVVPQEVVRDKVTKNMATAGKRIAMTLRMAQDDHLKLRLYAAHSRKSCQDIISDALEVYLSKDDKVCNISDCSCLNK